MHNSSPNLPPSQGCSPSGNEGVGGSKKTIEAGEGLIIHNSPSNLPPSQGGPGWVSQFITLRPISLPHREGWGGSHNS